MPCRFTHLQARWWPGTGALVGRSGAGAVLAALALGISGCTSGANRRVDQLIQRQEQTQLQVQQLEQRLNRLAPPTATPSRGSTRIPAGAIKSITYRSGTSDDRLRIYWADGSISDLPCTKEQNTLACG